LFTNSRDRMCDDPVWEAHAARVLAKAPRFRALGVGGKSRCILRKLSGDLKDCFSETPETYTRDAHSTTAQGKLCAPQSILHCDDYNV
jgi:hypothetical protein